MKTSFRFVVIDDDPLNNALCQMVINIAVAGAEVKTFTVPETGFKYIATEYSRNGKKAILLLDLNMPTMSGWEFLERFERLDEKIKNRFKIYVLSSSVDPRDKERAASNKNVLDYIIKPLTKEIVVTISSGEQ